MFKYLLAINGPFFVLNVCTLLHYCCGCSSDLLFPQCYSGLHLQGEGHQGAGLIRAVGILWPFELYFESLHADLEAIHGLDGSLGTGWVIEAHKA